MPVYFFKEYALKNAPLLMLRLDQKDILSASFVIYRKDFFQIQKKISVCVQNNILLLHYLESVLLAIILV